MAMAESDHKPHAVLIPYPAQSHIKAMLKLAKLLHQRGFHITFVNTEFNHNRFLKSLGPNSCDGLPDFHFETIPDGLPPSDEDATQDIPSLCDSITNNLMLPPFLDLLKKPIKNTSSTNIPPVTCIICDGFMSFGVEAGGQLGIPVVVFFSIAACAVMGFRQYPALMEKGLAPLKDEQGSLTTSGFLDMVIDWIPGMKDIRLKDLPTLFRIANPSDLIVFKFVIESVQRANDASAVVIHTFHALEQHVVDALSSSMTPQIYTIGPLQLLLNNIPQVSSENIRYSLWKEETQCLQWLDSKPPNSVVYVNFGSITVMTPQQMVEFGMGLAKSKHSFLWVIRPDLVIGKSAVLPPEFEDEVKERGLIATWCSQEQVLNHPSVGGFLTHCGWNSTIESLSAGVPMLCWPFFAEQQTNCRYVCKEWEVGMEIDNNVKRDEIEKLVRELMEGVKGKQMKAKAKEWKKLAEQAAADPLGSSSTNFDNLVNHLLSRK
ncbi:7-deoxyloganetin glucosyltransferase-like [Ziziphus jujuba]|uniref:Glycosyltransferase n=1 Tax=Ziziphus jujuba TaxID=326968 RepID=A0ABM3IFF3_ZIZJJ|nr:7-deoxyloganetin glucosyltransferase-like [Ziziphus jujuba]